MPQFIRYKTTGYGTRLMKSFGGVVVGLLLFVASFGLLYWNEGRFDLSLLAKTAQDISAETLNTDSSLNGALVSTNGTVFSDETLGDDLFLLPGSYVAVKRIVEMYAWVETQKTEKKENLGGSETETTTYTYKQEWTESPQASSNFAESGYINPQKIYDSAEKRVQKAKLGAYDLDFAHVDLPSFTPFLLSADTVVFTDHAVLANNQYVFVGSGQLTAPVTGDLRVSYSVVRSGVLVTAFAKIDGERLTAYSDADGHTLFRLFDGTRGEAIALLHTEFVMITWGLRFIGFLMMWFGMALLFEPLSVLLSVLPIFSAIGRTLFAIATFFIAVVLSLLTIFISMIAHNVIVLVIVVGGFVVFSVHFLNQKRKEKGITMPSVSSMVKSASSQIPSGPVPPLS